MIQLFTPIKKAKTGAKNKEHQLTIGKAGRGMFTGEGAKLLGLEAGDGVIQGSENGVLFIAKRPIGVTTGYTTSSIKGSLSFGGKTLLQLYPAGRYKLVEYTVDNDVAWYKLEVVPTKIKEANTTTTA